MRQPFVPLDFKVPQEFIFGNYKLVFITTKDVDEDLKILTGNAETIVKLRGGSKENRWQKGWPYEFSREENYQDLAWLEICAKCKQLFSYIIRNKEDNSYAGCIYIYPIELFYSALSKDYDVDFSFWITKKEYDNGVYEEIFLKLLEWLSRDWPFKRERIYLRNKEIPEKIKRLI